MFGFEISIKINALKPFNPKIEAERENWTISSRLHVLPRSGPSAQPPAWLLPNALRPPLARLTRSLAGRPACSLGPG